MYPVLTDIAGHQILANDQLADSWVDQHAALDGRFVDPTLAEATEVLERAFRNPAFVRATFPTAVAALGPQAAVAALPADPACLQAAADTVGPSGGPAAELISRRLRALPAGAGSSRPVS